MTLAQLFDLAFGNIGRFFKQIAFQKRGTRQTFLWTCRHADPCVDLRADHAVFASYSTGYYRFKGGYLPLYPPAGNSGGGGGLVLMYLISKISTTSCADINWYLYILTLLLLVWALFSEPYNGCYLGVYVWHNPAFGAGKVFGYFGSCLVFADRYYEKRGTLLYGIVLPVAAAAGGGSAVQNPDNSRSSC